MVHRCLLVPELFRLVCEDLQPHYETPPGQQSAALAALARTCHAFEVPALDVLWRELVGLRPLLCTMPSDLFRMKEKDWYCSGKKEKVSCLCRAILPTDLARFTSYALRIRKIQIDSRSFVDVDVVHALSMATLHMRPLLPNIKDLSWGYWYAAKGLERSMLPSIYLFLSPKLTTLSITLFDNFDAICLTVLSDLIDLCPALKDLTFRVPSRDSNEENRQSVSSAICQWPNLQFLRVTDLTQEALEHLASIPSLQALSIHSLRGATRSYDQCLPNITRNPTGAYPTLRSLSISCRTMDLAIAFIQLLSFSPVEDLEINVEDCCYLPQWRELFSTVSRHVCHASLKQLNLQETESHVELEPIESAGSIRDIGLDDLTVFSNLREVDVHPSLGIPLTSEMVNKLTVAWPHIEYLELGTSHRSSRLPIITTEDLIPFAKHCPKLKHLGIVFDARDIQLTSLKPGRGLFSNSLSSLTVGDSPIDSPGLVAAFLSDIFPRTCSITFDGDPEDEMDDGRMWDEVETLLEIFAKVRSQEKSSMEMNCHCTMKAP